MAFDSNGFIKHLKRHGSEGLMDTARELGASFDELVELQTAIDVSEPKRKHRKSAEARVRTWLGLDEKKEA